MHTVYEPSFSLTYEVMNMNLLFVFQDYKFPKKGTVGSRNHVYFLFWKQVNIIIIFIMATVTQTQNNLSF